MDDLIERLKRAAMIHEEIGGQTVLAATIREAAAALEAAREDASRWRDRYVAQLACYRQDLHGDMANDSIERAEKAAERTAMLDQARGKGVAGEA